MEYLILTPEPQVTELTWQAACLPAFILLLATGFVEEFIFRGVLQRTATEAFGGWGIVYISFIFAVLHIGWIQAGNPLAWLDVIFVFVVALFFGWVVKKRVTLRSNPVSRDNEYSPLYSSSLLFLGEYLNYLNNRYDDKCHQQRYNTYTQKFEDTQRKLELLAAASSLVDRKKISRIVAATLSAAVSPMAAIAITVVTVVVDTVVIILPSRI